MDLLRIYFIIYQISLAICYDSQSSEASGTEGAPFYDAVIFSDIVDIINDFDNNVNPPSDVNANSESDNDENIEDLLSEYQHYLDKAYEQKKVYIEKSKPKNKVPLSRHDKFMKMKASTFKNNSYKNNYYNPSLYKYGQTEYNNPLDFVIPMNFKLRHPLTSQVSSGTNNIYGMNLDKTIVTPKRIIDLPSNNKSLNIFRSSCYCKANQLPCDCDCKQCLIPFKPSIGNDHDDLKITDKKYFHNTAFIGENFNTQRYNTMDKVNGMHDNTLNLRIKVDISLPNVPDYFSHVDNTNEHIDSLSKEIASNTNVPLSFYNFPIPLNMYGFKKIYKMTKHDSVPLQKVTLHKKKKSRVSNGNKKNRKKLITFHNIKLEPQQFITSHYEDSNIRNMSENNNNKTFLLSLTPNEIQKIENMVPYNPNKTESDCKNQTQQKIYLSVNITNNYERATEDHRKIENIIENEYTKKVNTSINYDIPTNLRIKRHVLFKNTTAMNNSVSQARVEKNMKLTKDFKKNDKSSLTDTELLYWPSNYKNRTDIAAKNITATIFLRENKKGKLNITKEAIKFNHSRVIEQVIFGDVDWNDINTVALTFMSFFGKYIKGALTFCSQDTCHSMKCAEKTCVHRVCTPEERINNKGHCTGSKNSDNIASMESIIDLPSNIAFEIVDILQDKMSGKIFGKGTICINSKCISLEASKKFFKKTKCTLKELNSLGHCTDIKLVKAL